HPKPNHAATSSDTTSQHCHRMSETTRSDICATRTCMSTRRSRMHSQTNSGTTYPKQQCAGGDANTPERLCKGVLSRQDTQSGQDYVRLNLSLSKRLV